MSEIAFQQTISLNTLPSDSGSDLCGKHHLSLPIDRFRNDSTLNANSQRWSNDVPDSARQPDDDQETDKFSINLPMGGLNVSGPNASKLWAKIGWSIIIGVSALSMSHLLRAVAEITK